MYNRPLYYTGVGSRKAPLDVCNEMVRLAAALGPRYILRSGAAAGTLEGPASADVAFEAGARDVGADCEIYLPWKGYSNHPSPLYGVDATARALAATLHPFWSALEEGAVKLHSVSCYQVLGQALDSPSEFLVCWTPDGCETEQQRRRSTGGTATAIVLAHRNSIPVFNLKNDDSRERLVATLLEEDIDVSWLLQGRSMKQQPLF